MEKKWTKTPMDHKKKQLLKVVDLILKYTQTCGDDSFKKVVIKSHRKDVTQPE